MAGPFTVTPSTGDGVTTVFTSTTAVGGDVLLLVDRLPQILTTDYTYSAGPSSTTFTFVTAPVAGAIISFYSALVLPGATSTGTSVATLGGIRTQAQQRADLVNSTFVTTAEWNGYINSSYQELYDLLVQKYGDDYYFAGTPDLWYQITTDGTNASYVLPDGTSSYKLKDNATTAPAFFKGLGVDVQINAGSNGAWLPLKPFQFNDRNRLTGFATQGAYGIRTNLRYRFTGNRIWLTPTPQGGQLVRIWYTPRLTLLANDADTADLVNGWEEYIVVDAARKALVKEESDTTALANDKAGLIARIESAAENRDAGSPVRVTDLRGATSDDYDAAFREGFR